MATSESLHPAEESTFIDDASARHHGESRARTGRMTARIVGALFLFSNVTFMLGSVILVESVIGSPDYLDLVAASRSRIVWGALLALMNAVAYLGIAVIMFPILRKRFESLALAYVGFRIIEFIMQTLAELSPLSLVRLSEEFVQMGSAPSSSVEALGALLLAERFWAFQMISLTFGVGAFLFYYMLYRLRLIPRFLSIWGLVGAAIVLITMVLDSLGVTPAALEPLGVIMLLNELFLGVWLIVKGFHPPALTYAPDMQKA